jgi:hypothetical protein
MKTIPLTRGYETTVDDDDYEELNKYRWCVNICGQLIPYAARNIRDTVTGKQRTVRMHRVVMGVQDAPRTTEVDHRNHDTLDNRKENLRVTDHAGNLANRKGAQANSRTGIRGVFLRPSGKYQAWVQHRRQRYHLGYYQTLEEAAAVVGEARKRLFGE